MIKLLDAIDERTGLVTAWRAFADQPVPGGIRLRHVFPAVLTYLLIQQAVLGIVLSMYYVPSATDAWASTAYLNDQVTLGWFVRGLHYHGASAFVVASGLWMAQQAVHRAYRAPREIGWWAALGVMGMALALGLTGNPLPWDQEGYWSIMVELGIAEQTPGGGAIRTLIQGGSEAGNFTLTRLFVIHAFVLPAVVGLLLWVFFRQRRRQGAAPPEGMSETEAYRRADRYFPGQLFLDVLTMTIVAGVIIGLTIATHGAELWAPAEATENFQARPAWYFLFLYKLRMFFEGPLEPIATMVIPGAAVGFLVSVPFIDRFLGRLGRVVVLMGVGALMTGVVGMFGVAVSSDKNDEEYQAALATAAKTAKRSRTLALKGVQPLGGAAVYWNDPEFQVKRLYKENCLNCHSVDGDGGGEAPVLEDYSSRKWLAELIRNPNADEYFGKTKHDEMDPYPADSLPQDKLDATVEYLVKLSGDPSMAVDEALASKGASLWEDDLDCSNCHEIESGADGDGPNLLGHGSTEWVARVIRDSSKPDLFGKAAQMPKFADKLTADEIAQLAAFVTRQRDSGGSPDEEADAEDAGEADEGG